MMMFVSAAPAAVVFTLLCLVTGEKTVKVPTTTGVLHGKLTTVLQKPLTQFFGVPYAKPPVGELRFKPPVEFTSETVARDAASYAASCYQPAHMDSVISPLLKPNQAQISEDCLYLNMFVPEVRESEKPLPVMVWFPGEGFDYADPQQFDGSYLAVLGKVIVVTVNYRVSVFGFLSTLTGDAPGNVGLLDQRMALMWLKKNVAKFGGDGENVTLFGRFSGAMSIGIQAFSPLNRDEKLFRRVIMQSGVPVGDWVFDKNPLNSTLRLAEATGCLLSTVPDSISCLRRVPSDILLHEALQIPQRWRPVFDYHLIYEDVLKAAGQKSKDRLDILLGINNNEGTICTIALNAMRSPLYQKLLRDELESSEFYDLIDGNLMEIYKKKDGLLNKMAFHEYTNRQNKLRQSFVDFCGDLYVTSHVAKLADVVSSTGNGRTFMYQFDHRPSFSIHPSFIKAGHGDDVLFTLGLPFQLPDLPENEVKLTKSMIEAITNFARNGDPNGRQMSSSTTWPEYTSQNQQIMIFTSSSNNKKTTDNQHEMVVKHSSHEPAVSFWHDVVPAAQHRSCPVSAFTLATSFVPSLSQQQQQKNHVLLAGSFIGMPTAEYVFYGLLFANAVLLLTTMVATTLFVRAKRHVVFERLR